MRAHEASGFADPLEFPASRDSELEDASVYCEQAPNIDHLCETSRAKNQQVATPTGVQSRRLFTPSGGPAT